MVISNKYRNFALAFEKESNVGAIAQLVEQRTENPCVPGSIPGGTTTKSSSYLYLGNCFFVVIWLFWGGLCKPVCKPRCKPQKLWQQPLMYYVTNQKR